ncbi:hypothetical protein RDI58_006933 [Solanum bulbocastanum]|uniref:Uncharacterized protein n=1 Tax=Solanum bulbocastanum TaxID=147425 RepID=A0AAN8YI40_SOLBU
MLRICCRSSFHKAEGETEKVKDLQISFVFCNSRLSCALGVSLFVSFFLKMELMFSIPTYSLREDKNVVALRLQSVGLGKHQLPPRAISR